jgi:translocation and assembly module TamA
MFFARPHLAAAAYRQPRILAQIVLTVCITPALVPVFSPAAAQEAPAPAITYTVRIDAPRQLENLLEDNLDLVRFQGNAKMTMDQLQRLVKVTPDQSKTLLETEGYYSAKVTAGLETRSNGNPLVRVIVEPGPAVTVGALDLTLQGYVPYDDKSVPLDANDLRTRWALPEGARFRMADWEAAKKSLVRSIAQTRFPRAQLAETGATVDPEKQKAALKVVVDSGPEMRFGETRIRGIHKYPESIITNQNKIRPGDEYSEAAMQALQQKLQDTGYFASVEVTVDMRGVIGAKIDALDEAEDAGTDPVTTATPTATNGPTMLPVIVRVTENKQKNVTAGVGMSTNTGARAQLAYDDLSVFGLRMKSNLIYEQKQQLARADFYWPTTPDGYNDSVGGGYTHTDIENEITAVTSISAKRAWGTPLLERSIQIEALTEKLSVGDIISSRAKSVPVTYSITKRELDSLIAPTRGYAATAQLGVAVLPVLTDEKFVRAYARVINYRPLGKEGTLILRGEAGAVASKEKVGVPSTVLFRAGGDQSVRGYAYQELGRQVGNATVGSRYLATASAEYDWWFKPPYGVAFFVDAGNAADTFKELKPKYGYGVGARWRSPVGPINVDVAYGQAVKKVHLHFSLGFTF